MSEIEAGVQMSSETAETEAQNEGQKAEVITAAENIRETDNKKRRHAAPFPAGKTDKWMAAWMFVVAYMAVEWFWIGTNHAYYGAGVFLYTMLYGLTVLVYAVKSGHKLNLEGIFWFGVMALCGFSYVWVYNQSLMLFLALLLRLVSLYFTAVVFEVLMDGKTGAYFLADSFLLLVAVPLKNLTAQLNLVGQKLNRIKVTREILYGLAGCLAAIPLLLVVIQLLSGADENFSHILTDGFQYLFGRWSHFLWTGIVAVPVGAYLYGQMYGCAKKRGTEEITTEKVKKNLMIWAVIPMAGMVPALVSVVILYLLFIGLQGSYYFDALRGVLPEGFTYSGYARQGFFELVAISIINMGIICLAHLLYRRSPAGKKMEKPSRFLKYYTVIISVLTLFLIGTAMTKMVLYIQAYGLTPLRVIPSVFMVFLAVVFLLTAASRFVRIPVMRISVCVFAAGFTVMALCGMDGRIAAYNLARYEAGTLEQLPSTVLVNGSIASMVPMYNMWQSGDEEVKAQMEEIANEIYWDYNDSWSHVEDYASLNLEKRAGLEALREMRASWEKRMEQEQQMEQKEQEQQEQEQQEQWFKSR